MRRWSVGGLDIEGKRYWTETRFASAGVFREIEGRT